MVNLSDTSSYPSGSFYLRTYFFKSFSMHRSHYLLRSVHANICPRLALQSVGTSFINKLPFHSTSPPVPSSHSTAGGDSFHVSIHGLAVNGPFIASICERASSTIGSLERPHLRRGPATDAKGRSGRPLYRMAPRSRMLLSHLSVDFSALLLALRPPSSPPPPPPPPQTLVLVLRLKHLLTPLPLVTGEEPPSGSLQWQRKPGHVRTTKAAARQEVSATSLDVTSCCN